MRLACARHLRDLKRQRTPAFPYYFDPAEVHALIEFFADYLTLDDVNEATGDALPFTLMRWLQFGLGSMVAWKRVEDHHLRFVEGYFETAKGSTKTPAAAGYGLYRMVGAGRSNVENYSLGVNGAIVADDTDVVIRGTWTPQLV